MVAKVYFPNFHSMNIAEIKNRLAKRATDLSAAGFKPTYSDKECWIGRVAFYKEDESIPMDADGTPMLPLLQLSLDEEKNQDARMTALAESRINRHAAA